MPESPSRDSSIDAATAPPHLRDAAIAAATAALLAEDWGNPYPDATHGVRDGRGHHYDGACALCKADLARIVPVALDAADAAIRDLDDTAVLLDHLQDAEGELRAALAEQSTELRASSRIATAMASAIGWETPGETWVDKAAYLAPLAAELEAKRELRAARNGEAVKEWPRSVEAFHPGEMLKDELDERGMTQADLADALGHAHAPQVSRLCNGRADINAALAVQLERPSGGASTALRWGRGPYDLHHARLSDPELSVFEALRAKETPTSE